MQGHDPLNRLKGLRAQFFEDEQSLGRRKIPLLRQSRDAEFATYRENARWDQGGVTFVTLHVVGSNDGLGRSEEGDKEHADRKHANIIWLRQAFAHAKSSKSRAIMILQQANMYPESTPFPGKPMKPSGFTELRELLEQEATAFRDPVVLVHGDSHYFRIDNPLRKSAPPGGRVPPSLENFRRVETFGTPNHHWLHVTVDLNDPNVFTFRPRMVRANFIKRQ
ncbi:MAG: hypothetical protein GEU95_11790 [Rhizobiales bacterium]|nr:hypothetical protein [Hyphomicrobiales bacterium]